MSFINAVQKLNGEFSNTNRFCLLIFHYLELFVQLDLMIEPFIGKFICTKNWCCSEFFSWLFFLKTVPVNLNIFWETWKLKRYLPFSFYIALSNFPKPTKMARNSEIVLSTKETFLKKLFLGTIILRLNKHFIWHIVSSYFHEFCHWLTTSFSRFLLEG